MESHFIIISRQHFDLIHNVCVYFIHGFKWPLCVWWSLNGPKHVSGRFVGQERKKKIVWAKSQEHRTKLFICFWWMCVCVQNWFWSTSDVRMISSSIIWTAGAGSISQLALRNRIDKYGAYKYHLEHSSIAQLYAIRSNAYLIPRTEHSCAGKMNGVMASSLCVDGLLRAEIHFFYARII